MKKQPRISVISKRRVLDMIHSYFNKLHKKVGESVKSELQKIDKTTISFPAAYNFDKENPELDEDIYADMDGIGFDLYGNPVKCF
jgi:hypothetical protein